MAKKIGVERFKNWAQQVANIDNKYQIDDFSYSTNRKLQRVLQSRDHLIARLNEKAFGLALMTGDGKLVVNVIRQGYRALLVSNSEAS